MLNHPFLQHAFVRFCIVGGSAFIIDGSMLTLNTLYFSLNPIMARVISFFFGATYTWWFNRNFTFNVAHKKNLLSEWKRYIFTTSFGAAINWGVYLLLLYTFPLFYVYPIFALIGATACSMFFNYFAIKTYAFKKSFN